MEFEISNALSILERTPKVLRTLLKDLSSDWTQENEGENTWSPFDVVGHLIHGEKTDWLIRVEIILRGTSEKFEVFDRFAQFENSEGKTLNQLLNELEQLRNENLDKLKSMDLSDSNLALEGIHPGLGRVNLKQLLSTWVSHDLSHISQITRVMAKQYKDEVGPWKEYMGILKK